ncbi:MAG: hydroxymethylbilane synthase [Myxococcota bacterium]
MQDRPLDEVGGTGLFSHEIEQALMKGSIDVAVHSMKDVPTGLPEGLVLGGMLQRANPMDALICREGGSLATLPRGATVGTSSLRRTFQLLHMRSDLTIKPLRGNVDTRLAKLRDPTQGLDAIVLAMAGLERLGMGDEVSEQLGLPRFFPAIGQGAMGLEIRADDTQTATLIKPLRHAATEACVLAERGLLERLEGDCHLPIACHAILNERGIWIQARLGLPDASEVMEDDLYSPDADDPATVGRLLGDRMIQGGAGEMMEELATRWGDDGS